MTLTSDAGASRAPGGLRMTPGRWVAVALAVPVALALIGWTGFSLVSTIAQGSYQFSYPVTVSGGQVALNVSGGNITLRQTPAGAAGLTGVVQYGLIRPGIYESSTASGTDLGLSCSGNIDNDCGMNATLDVPPRTAVTLHSYGGDVAISSFTGHLTLSTGGGNINAGRLGGTLQIFTYGGDVTGTMLTGTGQISTGGGNIDVGDLAGDLQIFTYGGDLTGNAMSGNVHISTGGGNVNGDSVTSPRLTVLSYGGDVSLDFAQPPADLSITTGDGNITLALPPGGTKYDILTPNTDGGNVNYPPSLFSSTSTHTITANSGGGDITITQS